MGDHGWVKRRPGDAIPFTAGLTVPTIVYHTRVRALITGATGFIGSHLAAAVFSQDQAAEVWGMGRPEPVHGRPEAALERLSMVDADLLDAGALHAVVARIRPDVVYHLAGFAAVAEAWTATRELFEVNILGTAALLDALRAVGFGGRVVLACSAEAYGPVPPAELPVSEDRPLRPISPYGVSKAAAELLAVQQHLAARLRTVRLRLFNACGPGQSERFVVASLAHQVAEIEANRRPPVLEVGALDTRRDFVDVRDVARAFVRAAEDGEGGAVYNVATGHSRTVRAVLDELLTISGVRAEVRSDPVRLRPVDIPALEGDASRLNAATGWAAEVPFPQTLADTLADWRSRSGRGA